MNPKIEIDIIIQISSNPKRFKKCLIECNIYWVIRYVFYSNIVAQVKIRNELNEAADSVPYFYQAQNK